MILWFCDLQNSMNSSFGTTDVQICVKYIEHFSFNWQHSFRLSCFGLKELQLTYSKDLSHRTCGDKITSMMYFFSSWLKELYKWQAASMGWGLLAAKDTSVTWRNLVSPPEKPLFRYLRFIKHRIFCYLMLYTIIRYGHSMPSSMGLKNQIHDDWNLTFSIASRISFLGDNNSTEEYSRSFWHRKSCPHVALWCRRQWENISKSLSNISFLRVPKSVSSYAVSSQLPWKKKKNNRKVWKKRHVNT